MSKGCFSFKMGAVMESSKRFDCFPQIFSTAMTDLPAESIVAIMSHLPLLSLSRFGQVSKEHYRTYKSHFVALRVFFKLIHELKGGIGVRPKTDTHFVLKQVKEVHTLHPGCWDANQINFHLKKTKIVLIFMMDGGGKRRITLCPRDDASGHMYGCTGRLSYRVLPVDVITNEFDLPW